MFGEPLMATCWTSAGDAASDRADLRSPVPLRTRVEAAAAAGFRGFGLLSADLPAAMRAHGGFDGVRALFEENGITHVELEDVPAWWSDDGPERETADAVRDLLLAAAPALGARHIKVTPDGTGAPWYPARWAARFGDLAARAADSGVRLGIEFFPWSNIATLADGLRLVEAAGHDNAGVIIDVWHTERGGTPVADLAAVPVERIIGVELNDADRTVVGTLFEDTVHRRRYCGDGDFDLTGAIASLRRAGWRGPWGVEILSDEHRALDVATACRRAFDTADAVLTAAAG
ncbi:sugar phosphate isomerase/epimerase family protein [Pseudonocardia sp. ICBG601]|uniref:sugar phosphate isomerase/epimerase family protein n=1 Tax=Pseudonocardia sp. ICBG601 TaxID=2846759 RepID=UPI0027E25277|nr:sugar phosphate isomerase/epimerase family protein [Pseudonocardia sp. ICBG601]